MTDLEMRISDRSSDVCSPDLRPLAAKQAGAERDQSHASDRIAQLEQKPDFAGLADAIAKARENVAQAAVKLAEATRDATPPDAQNRSTAWWGRRWQYGQVSVVAVS